MFRQPDHRSRPIRQPAPDGHAVGAFAVDFVDVRAQIEEEGGEEVCG
jgi:hypothetical protein